MLQSVCVVRHRWRHLGNERDCRAYTDAKPVWRRCAQECHSVPTADAGGFSANRRFELRNLGLETDPLCRSAAESTPDRPIAGADPSA